MRLIASLLVCFIVAVTTLDRVACPDGCTDETPAQSAAPAASPSACTLCHGWSPAVSLASPSPVAPETLEIQGPREHELASHPPTIDHPPRPA